MILPASGPLSLSQIQTEFGGTNPISISEYYAAATGIPASGEISIADFYGASATGVDIVMSALFSAENTAPADARMEVLFKSNGLVRTKTNGGSEIAEGRWWSAGETTGIGNDYQIRATYVSGQNINIGSTGTWFNMTGDNVFGMLETSNLGDIRNGDILIEIRDVATSTVQDSITINIQAITSF